MGIKVKVTTDLSGVQRKLGGANLQRGRFAMANQMKSDMNQFVPMRKGTLRGSGIVVRNSTAIEWHTPYAKPQFYGIGKGGARIRNYTIPGTSRRWDLRAKGKYMGNWVRVYAKGANLS